MEVLLVLGGLVLLNVLALLFGVDSREGFFDPRYERPNLMVR